MFHELSTSKTEVRTQIWRDFSTKIIFIEGAGAEPGGGAWVPGRRLQEEETAEELVGEDGGVGRGEGAVRLRPVSDIIILMKLNYLLHSFVWNRRFRSREVLKKKKRHKLIEDKLYKSLKPVWRISVLLHNCEKCPARCKSIKKNYFFSLVGRKRPNEIKIPKKINQTFLN